MRCFIKLAKLVSLKYNFLMFGEFMLIFGHLSDNKNLIGCKYISY